jgi:two-component system cell cycle sensor histidine kinase/response regulator CckA
MTLTMTEATRKIKVLFLEDNPADVDLELYELRKGGFDVHHQTAKNREQFLAELKKSDYDIIIADYSLPDITGIEALHICQREKIDIPIMLITGAGNEQIAVDSLRKGAIDYMLKKNISGLAVRVSRALDIWADMKAVKTMEAEKQRLQKQLLQAQKMESIGLLAGGIAHDFNNLLTGIIGYAGLSINMLPTDSPATKNLRKILGLSDLAANLIKQLLVFSRKIPLALKISDINALISRNIEFIRRMVEENIEIRLNLQDDLPPLLLDEAQFAQVLINMAVNSRDAIAGSGMIEIKTENIPAGKIIKPGSSIIKGEYIRISVLDTGCGISENNLPKIFDPFFTTKEVGKGTGLGLAITYSIIKGHNGWIDVTSKEDKGTTFAIYLPVPQDIRTTAELSRTIQDQEPEIEHSFPGNKTILVVEDDEELRTLTADILESIGYRVITAADGKEALEIYLKNGQNIDLVFSDMVMPNTSGVELFTRLHKINPALKFVLVSGYNINELQGQMFEEMSALLMKPYTPKQIATLMREILHN